MRCYICDAGLADEDVRFNRLHQDYDPCGTCREIIKEAAGDLGDPEEVSVLDDQGYDDGTYYGVEVEEELNGD